ncbi:GDP-L-fucose synthase [Akkermansiaceae bacterium]|jgi:GDP-L-fucose synthase|nr:GDP-L-fucose synthase [Akkermansiaceae bacterium]MDB4400520.1 GDP-L-fucose synthase [Akkermansiaceae bacterium]MDB4519746.1 GDP-L-fucose synthase [Akkermansiaceae bacterium]|tara:strand:- start:5177 stop:6112 length:936 start_codon:yes stop_codon:yes gene_type:complete
MKIFIAGHRGMVGSALVREANQRGNHEVLTATRNELNLLDQKAVLSWLHENKPDQVIIAAAKVGGIHANSTYPAEFIYENLAIASNLIEGSRQAGVNRVLFLGSSCIYPKMAPQPMPEDCLLSSPLELTNEAYAVAKIAGLKMCQHYRAQYGLMYHSAMPTNLYGPGDNYHPENSHVIPGMIRRFHEAKERGDQTVTIWGSGTPKREFLHTDDLAAACFHLMTLENPPDWANVGVGQDLTIFELADLIAKTVGFAGEILTDPSKPDGTPRKLLDISTIKETGWAPQVDFSEGLAAAYRDFLSTLDQGTARL